MRKSRFTDEQMVRVLRQTDKKPVAEDEKPHHDRFAILTGAASGIGAALACALVEAGTYVLGLDRDAEGLVRTSEMADSAHFTSAVVDLTDHSAFERIIEASAASHGALDLLFNNAAINSGGEFADMDDGQLDRLMAVNTMAVLYGSRAACRIMRAQGHGHIVNTASSAGLMPVPWSSAYTASKHAVVGFSLALRTEAARYGVRVSVACPGLIDTPIHDSSDDIGDYQYRRMVESTPVPMLRASDAAREILRGVERNKATIVFPRINRVMLGLRRFAPGIIDRLSARHLASG